MIHPQDTSHAAAHHRALPLSDSVLRVLEESLVHLHSTQIQYAVPEHCAEKLWTDMHCI